MAKRWQDALLEKYPNVGKHALRMNERDGFEFKFSDKSKKKKKKKEREESSSSENDSKESERTVRKSTKRSEADSPSQLRFNDLEINQ